MRTDDDPVRGVLATMRAYIDANERGDVDAVLDLVVPVEGVVFTGSGAEDDWNVGTNALREQIERDQSEAAELAISMTDEHVSSRGDVAWLAARTTITAENESGTVTPDGRTTVVLERHGDRWLIAQSPFSLPFADPWDDRRSLPD